MLIPAKYTARDYELIYDDFRPVGAVQGFGTGKLVERSVRGDSRGGVPQCQVSLNEIKRWLPPFFWEYGDWSSFFTHSRGTLGTSGPEGILYQTDYRPYLETYFPTLENKWYQSSELVMPYGSQLKNFFVAIATVYMFMQYEKKRNIRILIVGSQSDATGGLWHDDFVRYLLFHGMKGVVDLYDAGQIPRRDSIVLEDGSNLQFDITGYNRWYQGDGKEYDLVIDDTYASGEPGDFNWLSKYWSKKNQSGKKNVFFHEYESRDFSHHVDFFQKRPAGLCQCPRCLFSALVGKSCHLWFEAISFRIEPARCYKCPDADFLSEQWLMMKKTGILPQGSGPAYERASSLLVPPEISSNYFVGKYVVWKGVDPALFSYINTTGKTSGIADIAVFTSVMSVSDCVVAHLYMCPSDMQLRGFDISNIIGPPGWTMWTRAKVIPLVLDFDVTQDYAVKGPIISNKTTSAFLLPTLGIDDLTSGFPNHYCYVYRKGMDFPHDCVGEFYFCPQCDDYIHWCPHYEYSYKCRLCFRLYDYYCTTHQNKVIDVNLESSQREITELRQDVQGLCRDLATKSKMGQVDAVGRGIEKKNKRGQSYRTKKKK